MNKHKLLIIGAGGHGRSVADAAMEGGVYEVVGFLDDGLAGGKIWGLPVFGPIADLVEFNALATHGIVAIGNNVTREACTGRLLEHGFSLATVVHPAAIISPRAIIGPGCVVMAGAVVGTETHLGTGVIINSGAVVDHHAHVHNYGHLGVGACMAGGSVLALCRSVWNLTVISDGRSSQENGVRPARAGCPASA